MKCNHSIVDAHPEWPWWCPGCGESHEPEPLNQ